jgi:uncharacterized Zn-finger protein
MCDCGYLFSKLETGNLKLNVAADPALRASLELENPLASTSPRVGRAVGACASAGATGSFQHPRSIFGTEGEKICGYCFFNKPDLFPGKLSGLA